MGAILRELFSVGLYKRTQGRVARQATFYTLIVVLGYAAYRMNVTLDVNAVLGGSLSDAVVELLSLGLPLVFFGVAVWVVFRLVNYPAFGDFLIAVEAEMNKVSWPNRTELYRATIVVLVVMFVMALSIFLFDLALHQIAQWIGIV